MRHRLGRHFLSSMIVGAVLVGCAARPAETTTVGARGPVNTGTFPNLNLPPKKAADQLSGDQTAADIAALQAAGGQNASIAAVPSGQADPATLKKLGETHAADTLKAIEQ
jgi:hypothetical protein